MNYCFFAFYGIKSFFMAGKPGKSGRKKSSKNTRSVGKYKSHQEIAKFIPDGTTPKIIPYADGKAPGPDLFPPQMLESIMQDYGITQREGRPASYKPEFCQQLITTMARGLGVEQAFLFLGVCTATAYNWCKEFTQKKIIKENGEVEVTMVPNPNYHEEFLNAVKIGRKLSQNWWLEIARLNLDNKNFNNVLWMMNMGNRFGWKQRIDAKVDAKAEIKSTHHEIKETRLVVHNLDDDGELAEVLGILEASGVVLAKGEKGNPDQGVDPAS